MVSTKITSAERIIYISQVMMPHQANVAGNIHGGEIIKLMDSAAYASSRRYAKANTVTARIDEVEFHLPIMIGDLVTCTAQIVYTGSSSMEISVHVYLENLETVGKKHALSAFFTMVALDKNGLPFPVPVLVPQTASEKLAFSEGEKRHLSYKRHKSVTVKNI